MPSYTPEQLARYVATAKAKRHAVAIASGRVPGKPGTTKRLTDEERAISLAKKRKRDSLCSRRIRTAKRAERALAEGRIPGKSGTKKLPADEALRLRKETQRRFRANHLERRREYEAAWSRGKCAEKAIAEGRVPGVIGHLSVMSADDLQAYLSRWRGDDRKFILQAKMQNYRARNMGIEGMIDVVDLMEILEEQKGCCGFCGITFDDAIPEIDHWVPLSLGGLNVKENIKLLHRRCNRTKGPRHPAEFTAMQMAA